MSGGRFSGAGEETTGSSVVMLAPEMGATSSSGEAWESDIGEFLMAAQQNGHKVQN